MTSFHVTNFIALISDGGHTSYLNFKYILVVFCFSTPIREVWLELYGLNEHHTMDRLLSSDIVTEPEQDQSSCSL